MMQCHRQTDVGRPEEARYSMRAKERKSEAIAVWINQATRDSWSIQVERPV